MTALPVVPDGRVLTDPDLVEGYRRDEADLVEAGHPRAVVLARTTADVVATLEWATAHRVPVVPRGAGTGLAGAAAAIEACVVLSLRQMDAIREISVEDGVAVVEPGVINADLGRAVGAVGLMYPPDPSSYEISTIGGNLATNAGGLRCVKYGVTRDSVLGLEVVLADGRVITTGGRTVKSVTGYDLTSLLVGSEGTLGVITAATLRLRPRPARPPVTLAAVLPTLTAAGEAVAAIGRAGLAPSLLEIVDSATINAVEDYKPMGLDRSAAALLVAQSDAPDAAEAVAAMAALCSAAGAGEVVVCDTREEGELLLAARRLAYTACSALGTTLVEDVGVPRSRLPEMIAAIGSIAARHGVRIATVGHAGDGNLHPLFILDPAQAGARERVLAAADEVFTTALALGGTITGEHGVGVLKRPWVEAELGADQLAVQRSIKAALDPLGVLNPGRAL